MFNPHLLHPELRFKAVRSSGKGGQHVNKVSTSVELYFDLQASQLLSDEQKQQVREKLPNRINSEGILYLVSQSERSQYGNKKMVKARFDELITAALKKKKKRVATKIPAALNQQRLDNKKLKAEKKQLRKKDW